MEKPLTALRGPIVHWLYLAVALLVVALGARGLADVERADPPSELLAAVAQTQADLEAVDLARRVVVDQGERNLAEQRLRGSREHLAKVADAVGGDARRLSSELCADIDAFLLAPDPVHAGPALAAARPAIDQLASAARNEQRKRLRNEHTIATATLVLGLVASIGVLAFLRARLRTVRVEREERRVLERDRRNLRRRLELVSAAANETELTVLGRRLVVVAAEETAAPVVVLHVAPLAEPHALEVIAAVGVSSTNTTSPVAVRETLRSRVATTITMPSRGEHLLVQTSSGTIAPTHVRMVPIVVGDSTFGVLEVGTVGDLDDAGRQEIDELLSVAAPGISHALAQDYAHHLSTTVRAQAETVAGVESELDKVFEALADGLAVTDDGGEITRINAAGCDILGLGRKIAGSMASEHNLLLEALREGTAASGLEIALTGGGDPRVVQVKLSRLNDRDEKSKAAVAVFRDVTRERQLEHELRRQSEELEQHVEDLESKRQELERAARLKSDFLANMSHELRTPLNAVIGFAEVLLEGTYGPLNEKQNGCAGDVLAGGRHLLGLINDILDLSKIEAAKMSLLIEDLELEGVVASAITFVRPQAGAKQIKIEVALGNDADGMVRADPDRLRQVLVNLLGNAVKFTPAGGSVRVTASLDASGLPRIAVTDTGIGIAPEHKGMIFQDFSQVDGSITRRFGGTGLGLAISKRLTEMMGGKIGFDSTPGKGSCFWFTVPRAERTQKPAFAVAPPLLRRSSTRLPAVRPEPAKPVLVVDRDSAEGRLAEHALRDAGFDPVCAGTIGEAMALVAKDRFLAIILDPHVDDADAEEALRFAREHFGTAIVVTSTQSEKDVCFDARCGFVHKPIDRASLVERLRLAIARRNGPRRALVVDPGDDAAAVRTLLEREDFVVTVATTLAAARASLAAAAPHVVVTELDFPDGEGEQLLRELAVRRNIAKVVLTARELVPAELSALQRIGGVVLRKGTLSRSAFVRHLATAMRETAPTRGRILAVDDNDQNLRLVSAVLAQKGFEILEARDGTTAVAVARAERPDVILMDLMLPDVDGLATTRLLKADVLTRDIPVIAVTAHAMSGDMRKATEAGCRDYVTKPIDATRLLRAVEAALVKKSAA